MPDETNQSAAAAVASDKLTYDINDPALQHEMVEADPEKDFFELPVPPPDGRHRVRVLLGERNITIKRQAKKGERKDAATGPFFVNAEIENRIDSPNEYGDGMPVFDYATSIIMASSGTSRLHGILRAIQAPAPARLSIQDLARHVVNTLASETATAEVETIWEAQVKETKNGVDSYRTVCKGMKNFPPDDTSPTGYSPIAIDKVTGQECRARAQVVRYYLPGA